jgi:hypothetical protein
VGSVYPEKTTRRSDEFAQACYQRSRSGNVFIMQKQNDAVNGFVVIIFKHYILSDKAVLE